MITAHEAATITLDSLSIYADELIEAFCENILTAAEKGHSHVSLSFYSHETPMNVRTLVLNALHNRGYVITIIARDKHNMVTMFDVRWLPKAWIRATYESEE